MEASHGVTLSSSDPLPLVRARLEEGCRRRNWTLEWPGERVAIALPTTPRMRGLVARFEGRLVNDGETTRLVGNTRERMVLYSALVSLACAGMMVMTVVQAFTSPKDAPSVVLGLCLTLPIPLGLSVLFGMVAQASTRQVPLLLAGLREMIEGSAP